MIHGALRDGRRRAANAPSTKFSFICTRPTAWQSRAFATPAAQGSATARPAPTHYRSLKRIKPTEKYKVDNIRKSETNKSKVQEYLRRLDQHLPFHLRSNAADYRPATSKQNFQPQVSQTAAFVIETNEHFKGFLPWLAVEQGRWKAAVWIVKLLLESYHEEPSPSNQTSHLIQQWNLTGKLDDLLDRPLYLKPQAGEVATPHIKTSSAASLHELTDEKPRSLRRAEIERHEILGVIWRGIGRLIVSCANDPEIAGGEVKPEILEMIALLHHYELMPSSIYTYVPSQSQDAIQQPPTLHLLSSRIMTALSDATWKAREMTAVEEAKRMGGSPLGLEAKGSSYRVRVSGVKPEVWLELILWSCLHGGWIVDGAALLGSFARSKGQGREQWMPISWRDTLSAFVPFGQTNLLDWDNIKYMFDNRTNATMDAADVTGLRVEKTVSSEVVNAYIDALLNILSVGVGGRGVSFSQVTRSLRELREFLQRADLNLGGGSWDAMLLRLVDSGGVDIEKQPSIVQRLVELSPRIGEELKSRHSQVLPSYVLDGSAALLGLIHRALHAEIKNGNLEGALKAFQLLQERVDNDRHRSLGDFFKHMNMDAAKSDSASKGLFTSNFSGIDYPSFDSQIPPTTLAAFLELVTHNKAFEFGRWMLNNPDIDGPIIPRRLYSEPAIAAAVIRFATAVNDKVLISQVTKLGSVKVADGDRRPTIPSELLQAFFDTQVELRQWQSALRILEYMRDNEGFDWNVTNAATVAKVMILESGSGTTVSEEFTRAEAFFKAMLTGRYGTPHIRDPLFANKLNSLCIVLSTIDSRLATFFHGVRKLPKHLKLTLGVTAFNKIVEAVAQSHGSTLARVLIERFTFQLSGLQRNENGKVRQIVQTLPETMPRSLRDAVLGDKLPRSVVTLADANASRVAVYGSQKLGPNTMQIVVKQALHEICEDPKLRESGEVLAQLAGDEALEIFVWALMTLRRRGIDQTAVWDELESGGLSEQQLKAVWEAVTAQGRTAANGSGASEQEPDDALLDSTELESGAQIDSEGDSAREDDGQWRETAKEEMTSWKPYKY